MKLFKWHSLEVITSRMMKINRTSQFANFSNLILQIITTTECP